MEVITGVDALRGALCGLRDTNKTIGFVPTMGNLHAGHLALIALAKAHADVIVVSIFVNPKQFDRAEDLERYPRTLEADLQQLESMGIDVVFTPSAEVMYPVDLATFSQIEVPGVSDRLEGAQRPGHFAGVATVVAKLFNVVQPDLAVFGEKDYQQLLLIRKLVADLNFPVNIIAQPTVREADGLALSSRNGLLSAKDRGIAPKLSQVLEQIAEDLRLGATTFKALEVEASEALSDEGFRPEYLEICNMDSLLPARSGEKRYVVLAAAWLGNVRLIDNLIVDLSV